MITFTVGKKEPKTMYIRGDSNQWSIGKIKTNKKGEDEFVGEKFYSSLEGVINGALEYKMRLSESSSLTELQLNLKQAKDELKGLYET